MESLSNFLFYRNSNAGVLFPSGSAMSVFDLLLLWESDWLNYRPFFAFGSALVWYFIPDTRLRFSIRILPHVVGKHVWLLRLAIYTVTGCFQGKVARWPHGLVCIRDIHRDQMANKGDMKKEDFYLEYNSVTFIERSHLWSRYHEQNVYEFTAVFSDRTLETVVIATQSGRQVEIVSEFVLLQLWCDLEL